MVDITGNRIDTIPGDGLLRTDGDTLGAGTAELVVDIYCIINEDYAALVADLLTGTAMCAFVLVNDDHVGASMDCIRGSCDKNLFFKPSIPTGTPPIPEDL